MPLKLSAGDIVELRKKHPCGGNTFEIMRAGMRFPHEMPAVRISDAYPASEKLEKSVVRILPQTRSPIRNRIRNNRITGKKRKRLWENPDIRILPHRFRFFPRKSFTQISDTNCLVPSAKQWYPFS